MRACVRVLSLLLLVSFSLVLLSCNKGEEPREYDEAQVLREAEVLLSDAVLVNRIVWGVGLSRSESEDAYAIGVYVECDPDEAKTLGLLCVDDIKALCRSVYTDSICQTVDNTVFSPVKDEDDTVISLVRYYMAEVKDSEENITEYLMVNTAANVYFEKDAVYHTNTVSVVGVEGQVLHLCVELTVYDEQDTPHERTLAFSMIEEDDGWRLATPTYMKYDPYADIYDNLTKK